MLKIHTVTKAVHIDGYRLELTFDDGVCSEVDFAHWIKGFPSFEPLKDIEYFKNFDLDGWTVCWPNGADISPATLYSIAVKNLIVRSK